LPYGAYGGEQTILPCSALTAARQAPKNGYSCGVVVIELEHACNPWLHQTEETWTAKVLFPFCEKAV